MKSIAAILVCFAFLGFTTITMQAAEQHQHGADSANSQTGGQKQVHKAQGTVNRIDENAGKLNVSHEAIPSLNWPAMTMDFQVKDKSVLKGVTPGQKVTMDIEQQGPGKFVVTRLVPVSAGSHH